MKTICLDFDDFSVLNNRLDLLLRLKESYPTLKVSMFTIPYDYVYENNVSARIMRDKSLEAVKKNLDWIEIVPHGLTHMPRELEKCDYKTMREYTMPAIDECFAKDSLPYVRGFKPPYWLWNEDIVRALDDEGWWGAVDRFAKNTLRTKKYYMYTHTIDQPFWESNYDVLKLHGHITQESPNNIDRCFPNLFKMPVDAQFVFASDLLEDR